MTERLFNLAVLAVTVALLLVVYAAEAAGVITGDATTLIIGLVLGGGAGIGIGGPVKGKTVAAPPPEE